MALNIKQQAPKVDYGRVEDGVYPARVVRIIDMGVQPIKDWKTGEQQCWDDGNPKFSPKVWIDFELVTETIMINGESRPRWYGREYAVSSHEKAAIASFVKATACGSNLAAALGKPVMVNIGSTEAGKAKVSGVVPPMKGMPIPELENPPIVFDIDSPDMEILAKLPSFLKLQIEEAMERSKSTPKKSADKATPKPAANQPADSSFDDDVPF